MANRNLLSAKSQNSSRTIPRNFVTWKAIQTCKSNHAVGQYRLKRSGDFLNTQFLSVGRVWKFARSVSSLATLRVGHSVSGPPCPTASTSDKCPPTPQSTFFYGATFVVTHLVSEAVKDTFWTLLHVGKRDKCSPYRN